MSSQVNDGSNVQTRFSLDPHAVASPVVAGGGGQQQTGRAQFSSSNSHDGSSSHKNDGKASSSSAAATAGPSLLTIVDSRGDTLVAREESQVMMAANREGNLNNQQHHQILSQLTVTEGSMSVFDAKNLPNYPPPMPGDGTSTSAAATATASEDDDRRHQPQHSASSPIRREDSTSTGIANGGIVANSNSSVDQQQFIDEQLAMMDLAPTSGGGDNNNPAGTGTSSHHGKGRMALGGERSGGMNRNEITYQPQLNISASDRNNHSLTSVESTHAPLYRMTTDVGGANLAQAKIALQKRESERKSGPPAQEDDKPLGPDSPSALHGVDHNSRSSNNNNNNPPQDGSISQFNFTVASNDTLMQLSSVDNQPLNSATPASATNLLEDPRDAAAQQRQQMGAFKFGGSVYNGKDLGGSSPLGTPGGLNNSSWLQKPNAAVARKRRLSSAASAYSAVDAMAMSGSPYQNSNGNKKLISRASRTIKKRSGGGGLLGQTAQGGDASLSGVNGCEQSEMNGASSLLTEQESSSIRVFITLFTLLQAAADGRHFKTNSATSLVESLSFSNSKQNNRDLFSNHQSGVEEATNSPSALRNAETVTLLNHFTPDYATAQGALEAAVRACFSELGCILEMVKTFRGIESPNQVPPTSSLVRSDSHLGGEEGCVSTSLSKTANASPSTSFEVQRSESGMLPTASSMNILGSPTAALNRSNVSPQTSVTLNGSVQQQKSSAASKKVGVARKSNLRTTMAGELGQSIENLRDSNTTSLDFSQHPLAAQHVKSSNPLNSAGGASPYKEDLSRGNTNNTEEETLLSFSLSCLIAKEVVDLFVLLFEQDVIRTKSAAERQKRSAFFTAYSDWIDQARELGEQLQQKMWKLVLEEQKKREQRGGGLVVSASPSGTDLHPASPAALSQSEKERSSTKLAIDSPRQQQQESKKSISFEEDSANRLEASFKAMMDAAMSWNAICQERVPLPSPQVGKGPRVTFAFHSAIHLLEQSGEEQQPAARATQVNPSISDQRNEPTRKEPIMTPTPGTPAQGPNSDYNSRNMEADGRGEPSILQLPRQIESATEMQTRLEQEKDGSDKSLDPRGGGGGSPTKGSSPADESRPATAAAASKEQAAAIAAGIAKPPPAAIRDPAGRGENLPVDRQSTMLSPSTTTPSVYAPRPLLSRWSHWFPIARTVLWNVLVFFLASLSIWRPMHDGIAIPLTIVAVIAAVIISLWTFVAAKLEARHAAIRSLLTRRTSAILLKFVHATDPQNHQEFKIDSDDGGEDPTDDQTDDDENYPDYFPSPGGGGAKSGAPAATTTGSGIFGATTNTLVSQESFTKAAGASSSTVGQQSPPPPAALPKFSSQNSSFEIPAGSTTVGLPRVPSVADQTGAAAPGGKKANQSSQQIEAASVNSNTPSLNRAKAVLPAPLTADVLVSASGPRGSSGGNVLRSSQQLASSSHNSGAVNHPTDGVAVIASRRGSLEAGSSQYQNMISNGAAAESEPYSFNPTFEFGNEAPAEVTVAIDPTGTFVLPFLEDSDPIVVDAQHIHTHMGILGVELIPDSQKTSEDERYAVCLWNHGMVGATGGYTDSTALTLTLSQVLADKPSWIVASKAIETLREHIQGSTFGVQPLPHDPIIVRVVHKEQGFIRMQFTVAPVIQVMDCDPETGLPWADGYGEREMMIGAILFGIPLDPSTSLSVYAFRTLYLSEVLEQFIFDATTRHELTVSKLHEHLSEAAAKTPMSSTSHTAALHNATLGGGGTNSSFNARRSSGRFNSSANLMQFLSTIGLSHTGEHTTSRELNEATTMNVLRSLSSLETIDDKWWDPVYSNSFSALVAKLLPPDVKFKVEVDESVPTVLTCDVGGVTAILGKLLDIVGATAGLLSTNTPVNKDVTARPITFTVSAPTADSAALVFSISGLPLEKLKRLLLKEKREREAAARGGATNGGSPSDGSGSPAPFPAALTTTGTFGSFQHSGQFGGISNNDGNEQSGFGGVRETFVGLLEECSAHLLFSEVDSTALADAQAMAGSVLGGGRGGAVFGKKDHNNSTQSPVNSPDGSVNTEQGIGGAGSLTGTIALNSSASSPKVMDKNVTNEALYLFMPFKPSTGIQANWLRTPGAQTPGGHAQQEALLNEAISAFPNSQILDRGAAVSPTPEGQLTASSNSPAADLALTLNQKKEDSAIYGLSVMLSEPNEIDRHKLVRALWDRSWAVTSLEGDFLSQGVQLLRSGLQRIEAVILRRNEIKDTVNLIGAGPIGSTSINTTSFSLGVPSAGGGAVGGSRRASAVNSGGGADPPEPNAHLKIAAEMTTIVKEFTQVVFIVLLDKPRLNQSNTASRLTVPGSDKNQASATLGSLSSDKAPAAAGGGPGAIGGFAKLESSTFNGGDGEGSNFLNTTSSIDKNNWIDQPNVETVMVTKGNFVDESIACLIRRVKAQRAEAAKKAELEKVLKEHRGSPWVRGRQLGKGGFGDVYEAEMTLTGGKMAVKIIKVPQEKSPSKKKPKKNFGGGDGAKGDEDEESGFIPTILNEIGIMCSVNHPNIVRYFYCEVSPDETELNLFMELCRGGSLAGLMGGKRALKEDEISSYVKQICSAVSYLHSLGYAHRDLKPANVLLTEGKVKVADFGTTRSVSGDKQLKDTAGTFQYMAPEIIRGEAHDKNCDIWSIGCVVLDLFKKLPVPLPYHGSFSECDTDEQIEAEIAKHEGLSPDCVDFVLKCLKIEPEDRWSAEQLVNHDFCTHAQWTVGLVSNTKRHSFRGAAAIPQSAAAAAGNHGTASAASGGGNTVSFKRGSKSGKASTAGAGASSSPKAKKKDVHNAEESFGADLSINSDDYEGAQQQHSLSQGPLTITSPIHHQQGKTAAGSGGGARAPTAEYEDFQIEKQEDPHEDNQEESLLSIDSAAYEASQKAKASTTETGESPPLRGPTTSGSESKPSSSQVASLSAHPSPGQSSHTSQIVHQFPHPHSTTTTTATASQDGGAKDLHGQDSTMMVLGQLGILGAGSTQSRSHHSRRPHNNTNSSNIPSPAYHGGHFETVTSGSSFGWGASDSGFPPNGSFGSQPLHLRRQSKGPAMLNENALAFEEKKNVWRTSMAPPVAMSTTKSATKRRLNNGGPGSTMALASPQSTRRKRLGAAMASISDRPSSSFEQHSGGQGGGSNPPAAKLGLRRGSPGTVGGVSRQSPPPVSSISNSGSASSVPNMATNNSDTAGAPTGPPPAPIQILAPHHRGGRGSTSATETRAQSHHQDNPAASLGMIPSLGGTLVSQGTTTATSEHTGGFFSPDASLLGTGATNSSNPNTHHGNPVSSPVGAEANRGNE